MAISRDKKQTLVSELGKLIESAKAMASATYTGLSVADMQELRKLARENSVELKVVKNRLVKVALKADKRFKDAELGDFKGQLIYAFSADDEATPSQTLAKFAKGRDNINLVAGFLSDGSVQNAATVNTMANLPTKDQLRGQLVSVIAAPMVQFMGVALGAQRGMAQVLSQRAEQI